MLTNRSQARPFTSLPDLSDTLRDIAHAVDSWDKPAQMPTDLVWFVAFMVGAWYIEPGPDGTINHSLTADGRVLMEERGMAWAREIAPLARLDPHTALRVALRRWLGSVPARFDDVENGTAADYTVRLGTQLGRLWPHFDAMSPFVAYELACALLCYAGEPHLHAAVTRLAPHLLPPKRPPGGWAGRDLTFAFMRDVATRDPILALKIGIETVLRSSVPANVPSCDVA